MGNTFANGLCRHSTIINSLDYTAIESNLPLVCDSDSVVKLNQRTISAYAISKQGYNTFNKPNQDRVLLHYDQKTDSLIAGVFDGHGKDGHIVASYIRDKFCELLVSNEHFGDDPTGSMLFSIKDAESQLVIEKSSECLGSGTTAVVAVVRSNKFICMNIGDSRMFYAFQHNKKNLTENINIIHCPDHDSEKARIQSFGGVVKSQISFYNEQATPRVYSTGNERMGLAMSRSVGDMTFRQVGVVSDPDFAERRIDEDSIGILLGSDGLTALYGMNKCFSTITSEENTFDGLQKLVFDCYNQAYIDGDKRYVDDISGIYIELKKANTSFPFEMLLLSENEKENDNEKEKENKVL